MAGVCCLLACVFEPGSLYITVNIAGDLTGLKAGRYKLKVCNILDGNNDMNQKNMIS